MARHQRAAMLISAACLAALACAAHAAPATAPAFNAPKTASGAPDFQGIWSAASITRLERDPAYGAQLAMTPDQTAKLESQIQNGNKNANKPTDANATTQEVNANCEIPRFAKGVGCGYNNGWIDQGDTVMRVNGQPRTSFITSTADGRLPAYQAGKGANVRRRVTNSDDPEAGPAGLADNPEDRALGERCIIGFGNASGPVMLPRLYNNNYQFVQTKDELAIVVEMVHDVRHIHLNAEAHLPSDVRPWMGDSIGHWEGQTLVVETTNYPEVQARSFFGASPNLKITERMTRVGPKRLFYQFTVDDPTTWQSSWSGEYEFGSAPGPVYEYACHEGNYGLEGILAGARADEKKAEEARTAKKTAANATPSKP
jgi:hypothetical protein